MAKCSKCGRKDLLFKVNQNGLCSNCAALTLLEEKERELNETISENSTDFPSLKHHFKTDKRHTTRLKGKRNVQLLQR